MTLYCVCLIVSLLIQVDNKGVAFLSHFPASGIPKIGIIRVGVLTRYSIILPVVSENSDSIIEWYTSE